MARQKSVRSAIFRSHLAIIVLMTLIYTTFFYFYTADILRKRAVAALQEFSSSFARSIDAEIMKMNNISLNITNSEVIKRGFADFGILHAMPESADRNFRKYQVTKQLNDLMFTLIGPLKPVPQVNLYSLDGGMVGTGIFSRDADLDVKAMDWFADLDLKYGAKLVSYPREDKLLDATFVIYRQKLYISICRVFFNQEKDAAGVIEVKQFHDEIFKNYGGGEESVFVFDGKGQQLYPLPGIASEWDAGFLSGLVPGIPTGSFGADGKGREMLIAQECRQTDWKVVVAEKEGLLLKPGRDFSYMILLLGIMVAAAAVWLASRVSAGITSPISNLKSALKLLEQEGILHDRRVDMATDLDEFGELQLSFNEMQAKVRESVHGMLEAKDGEMRATFLALQSQMDPHFLFNMLSVLAIMAEEGLNRELAETIGHLTHLLRYSASGSSSFVTLSEEMEYTRHYLLCMKTRFRDDLDFNISIPPGMESLIIPKLIVQPLAENCMKYATNREPPWSIRAEGSLRDGTWEIAVLDNGPGFDPAYLVDLNRILASRGSGGQSPGLDVGGMGLRSIASRLFLHFGSEAYCRVWNTEGGGACVAIGGRFTDGG